MYNLSHAVYEDHTNENDIGMPLKLESCVLSVPVIDVVSVLLTLRSFKLLVIASGSIVVIVMKGNEGNATIEKSDNHGSCQNNT
jgi:hypothetical protein